MANSVPPELRARFGRTVLFDVDPGPFQLWARQYELGVGTHDGYLTIGQNLGAPDCPVPLDDVPWQRVWPTVHLPVWPDQGTRDGERYTTVTQWWNGTWVTLGEETLDGNKRAGFLAIGLFLALNRRELAAEPLESIAIILRLAEGKMTELELASWIRQNVRLAQN